MLSPDRADAIERLTDGYASLVATDGYAVSVESIRIIPIKDPPEWLPGVTAEVQQLVAAADAWQQARFGIWAPVLSAFEGYWATFSALAKLKPADHDAEAWIEILRDTLLADADGCLTATRAARAAFDARLAAFSAVLPEMDKSIEAGWRALAGEEKRMLALTEQLGELNAAVRAVGSKIDSDSIAAGKDLAQTAASMLYEAGSAGAAASVPIVGMAVAVITIGKSFYDLVADDDELIATMNKINVVKGQLSDEAVAVALTKSTLQTLYRVEEQCIALRDALPELVDLWSTEKVKVQDAIDALEAGAQPDRYLGLTSLPKAAADWQAIETFVRDLMQVDMTVGMPVVLDIPKAQISPAISIPSPN